MDIITTGHNARPQRVSRVKSLASHLLSAALIMAMCITGALPALGGSDVYAASFSGSGTIRAGDGAVLRAEATTESAEKAMLAGGTQVQITREVFKADGKTDADTRWYLVKSGSNKGYVRSDLVTGISYPSTQAYMKTGANIRSGPSAEFRKLGHLKKGTPLTVHGKARVSGGNIWYMAEADGQTCYVNTGYVTFDDPQSAAPAEKPAEAEPPAPADPAPTPDQLSDDKGSVTVTGASQPDSISPGNTFIVKGRIQSSSTMTKVVAGVTDQNNNWCLKASADVNASSFDLAKLDEQLRFGTLNTGSYRYRVDVYAGTECYNKINSEFKVLANDYTSGLASGSTRGGRERIVGTFDTTNCTRLFAVTGTGKAQVPQGMAINGDKYYLVYGMSDAQAVVTYSSSGKRLAAKDLPFNMGHPNGITWDPKTGLCYIFRGNMYKCYTWNPANDSFGSVRTPYSSSGIAFDSSKGLLYATSQTGIREYSADGRFTHRRLFSRCWHSGRTYIQDCGASDGYIFHCVSGADKHRTNYLDIYREADGRYLGTVRINIDEAESAAVGPDGYVQILCNTTDTTDHIWKTPLNVRDLH